MSHAIDTRERLASLLFCAFLTCLGLAVFMLPLAPLRKVCAVVLLVCVICGFAVVILRRIAPLDVPSVMLLAFVVLLVIPNAANPDFWGFHLAYFGQILVFGCALFWLLRLLPLGDCALFWALLVPSSVHSVLLLGIGLWRFYCTPHTQFTYINSSGELVSRFYFYDNPNLAAIFATLSFALLLPFCVARLPRVRALAIVGVAAVGASIFLLASRAAIAIMALCVILFLLWNRREKINKKFVLLALACLVALGAGFFVFHIEVFMLKILYGNEPRPTLWFEGLRAYLESGRLLFGLGAGAFMDIDFSKLLGGEEYRNMWHAHNLFVQILVEYGLFALLSFCAFLFALLRGAPAPHTARAQAFWLAVVSFLCFALVEFNFWQRNALFALLLFGALRGRNGA